MKEKDIEAKLKQVINDWSTQTFQFTNFKTRGELLLKGNTSSSMFRVQWSSPIKRFIFVWMLKTRVIFVWILKTRFIFVWILKSTIWKSYDHNENVSQIETVEVVYLKF